MLKWLLAACCLATIGCEPVGSSLVSPSPLVKPDGPPGATSTICEAIRSGRVKPLVHVPECD